jgi:hypothetical protein
MRSRSPLLPAAALAALLLVALAGTLGSAQSRPDLIQKTGVDACPRVGEAPMPIACMPLKR